MMSTMHSEINYSNDWDPDPLEEFFYFAPPSISIFFYTLYNR
jgi:hypothetical protein